MLEIQLNIITANIGGHGDYGGSVELADQMAGGDPVQIRHDDIHQDQVVFGTTLDFIHRLQAIELKREISSRSNMCIYISLELTAVSITQLKEYRNFPPIWRQVVSSSTSKMWGLRIHPGSTWPLFFRLSGNWRRVSSISGFGGIA